MAVEGANRIHQLNSGAPANSDPASEGAGHLRVIKAAVKGSFPNFGTDADTGIVTLTAEEINALGGLEASFAELTPGAGLTGDAYDPQTAATFAVEFGTAENTACEGNDARLLKAVGVTLRNEATTLDDTYADEVVYCTTGGHTYTLSDTVPVGTQFQLQNRSAGSLTIALGGHTLHWLQGGALGTGQRTLLSGGVAVVIKIAAGVFHVYGGGLS